MSGAEVLEARGWMLRVLSTDAHAPPPLLSGAAWRASLRRERCGLILKGRLVPRRDRTELPAQLMDVIEEQAAQELKRILMARAQLLEVERLASENDLTVIVLKGGVVVLSDALAVDLVDIDVLAGPEEARMLAGLLDAAGYTGEGFSSTQHLHSRVRSGELMVEVHQRLDGGDALWSDSILARAIPIDGACRLLRLAPQDHLWHLLYHVGVTHPDRRGALRDLLLTGHAVAACDEAAMEVVAARVDAMRQRRAIHDLLAMARDMAEHREVEDRFARLAAAMFAMQQTAHRVPFTRARLMGVGSWATAMLCGWPEVRHQVGLIRMRNLGVSSVPLLASVEVRAPRLGRALRVGARILRLPVTLALASLLAIVAAVSSWRAIRSRGRRAPAR